MSITENYCLQCQTPIPENDSYCRPCYEEIPSKFTCEDCGETGYRKDGDFGAFVLSENPHDPAGVICKECEELSKEEYENSESFTSSLAPEYSEGWYDEML